MKSFDTDIKKYANKIRFKASERSELRERILTYMEYHPLPKQSVAEEVEKIESERFIRIHFNTIYTRVASGVFVVLLLVTIPFVAEHSVPGDILYSFKTNINEGIRIQLANSPYEKIVLETELLERRIAEARLLKSEGKLTEELEASISETVKGHANAAQQGIDELRTSNTEEAAIAEIAFGSALEVQSAVLKAGAVGATTSETTGIAGVVKDAQTEIATKKGTTTASFGGLMARVEIETTRAYELFQSIDESTTDEERGDIERRLEDVARKITKAQSLNASNDPTAIPELTSALTLTQKLIAFMTDIDVSENVELETLVPIELTYEERATLVQGILDEISLLRPQINAGTLLLEDGALLEKINIGLSEMRSLVNTATSSLEVGNIDTAEKASAEARDYALDLVGIVQNAGTPEVAEEVAEVLIEGETGPTVSDEDLIIDDSEEEAVSEELPIVE